MSASVTYQQFSQALSIVRSVLVDNGWSATEAKDGVEDGHWLLKVINGIDKEGCPACYEPTIKNLVKRLEEESLRLTPRFAWTYGHSSSVLNCIKIEKSH